MKIKKTYDYDEFGDLDGNRKINQSNLNKIMESMRKKYYSIPIIVNKKMQVIDGQHRLEACRQLNLPVFYFQIDGLDLRSVHTFNSIGKPWAFIDYLDSYVRLGKPEYIKAQALRNKYPMNEKCLLFLLTGKQQGGDKQSPSVSFREGNLKIKNLEECYKIAEQIDEFIESFEEYNFKRSCVRIPLMEMMRHDQYDHEHFKSRLDTDNAFRYIRHVRRMTTIDAWRRAFQKAYNFNVRKKGKAVAFWKFDVFEGSEVIEEDDQK